MKKGMILYNPMYNKDRLSFVNLIVNSIYCRTIICNETGAISTNVTWNYNDVEISKTYTNIFVEKDDME
jgi:hypothetical protein